LSSSSKRRTSQAPARARTTEAPRGATANELARGPRVRWLALAVFVLTAAVFVPSLSGEWLDWDDAPLLLDVESWRGLSARHLAWMATTFHMGPYQPLSWLSYAVDHAFWGLDPRGYHATNVLLHATSAVLFFFLARRILSLAAAGDSDARGDQRGPIDLAAAASALVWAIHPLRVESVAWITERRDCLSGVFFLLAVQAWLEHCASAEESARRRWYRLALLAFVASVLAKGVTLVLPAVLLVLDVWPLRRRSSARADRSAVPWSTLVLEKWPFFAVSIAAGVLAVVGQQVTGAIVATERHGIAARAVQAFYGLAFYAGKSLWPAEIEVFTPLPHPFDPGAARFVAAATAVSVAAVLLVLARRRAPGALAAFACYALIVAPVLGLVQSGSQLVAARYSYLAALPLSLLAGGALLAVARRLGRHSSSSADRSERVPGAAVRTQRLVLAALSLALLAPLDWATVRQCRVWHDTFSLWRHDLAIDPASSPARRSLIVAWVDRARSAKSADERRRNLDGALAEIRAGLEHGSDAAYFVNAAKVEDMLADDEPDRRKEHLERALAEAQRAVDFVEHSDQRLSEAYESAAALLCKLERPAEAIPFAEKLVALEPREARWRGMLGDALLQAGRAREALSPLEEATRLAPRNASVWLEIGEARRQLGEIPAAEQAFRRVLELKRAELGARSAEDEEAIFAAQALSELSGRR
jgi:tetratricopeptide (TPR) repeat protein